MKEEERKKDVTKQKIKCYFLLEICILYFNVIFIFACVI